MSARLAALVTGALAVVLWSAVEVGAQTCPDESIPPQATSEQVDFSGIAPGQRRSWTTTVTNTRDVPVAVHASLEAGGALAAVLHVGLRSCDTPWQADGNGAFTCASGGSDVVTPTPLGTELDVTLPTLAPSDSLHALFDAELPHATGNEYQGATGSVRSLMVWQQQCGSPTTSTPTTSAPPTSTPSPTAVPVTAPPTTVPGAGGPSTTGAPSEGRPGSPRPGSPPTDAPGRRDPRRAGPAARGAMPFTGAHTRATLVVAALLLLAGAATLVVGDRRRAATGDRTA